VFHKDFSQSDQLRSLATFIAHFSLSLKSHSDKTYACMSPKLSSPASPGKPYIQAVQEASQLSNKMKLTYSLLPTIFAALTVAVPPIARQTAQGTYVCEKANWQGICRWVKGGTDHDAKGDCHEIPFAKLGNWVSFGPDQGLKCVVYPTSGCMCKERMRIDYPGSKAFPAGDTQGAMLSFRCVDEMTIVLLDKDGKGNTYVGAEVIKNQG
jgi:hypothetical protein